MKKMNFWKTLLGSMMVLAAFTACSDDDTEDGGYKGIPEITVDGGTSTTIAGSLAGGKLEQTVEVVAKGDWELSFENESDATWCTPSPMSGTTGTTQISFTLGEATAERQATLTLTAVGFVEGIPVTKTASILVKQNEAGTTEVTTNVKSVRDQLTFEQTGKEITESLVLTGIVVSDYVGNNINNRQIMVTDNTTEPGAGLMIRFKGNVGSGSGEYNLTRGSIISLDLKGGTAQSWYGTYQVQFTNADPEIEILDTNDNTPEAIEVSDPSKLIDYQSQYVKVYSQPVESIRGEKYYNVSSGYANQTFQTKDGSTFLLSFYSYSKDWASTIEIPAKAGYIKGCVSLNNNAGNISPRNADDLAGMTDDLFTVETPEPEKTTIAQITATGQYEIEAATVVATYTGGFVMSDETASILVYLGYGAENIPAVGDVVSVSGSVTSYGDAFQFAEGATVTKTGTTTVEYPNPTEITESNIGGLMEKPVVTYVKMTGTLSVSGNYYNIEFPFETSYTGSISGPNADLNAGSYDGQMVTVEGYFVNNGSKNGGGRYFTVVATKLTPDSSTPIVTFTTQPTTFAASNPEPQTITYTVANVDASAVSFAVEGTNADKFTAEKSGDAVVVKAVGDNTTDAAYTATLVAKVNGETLASVDLKQAAPASGDGYALISSLADLTAGEYYMAGMIESYNDITYAPYSYHLWVGTVSGSNPAKSNSDLETVNYQYESNQLTLNPNLSDRDKEKGTAAFITLEAVSGKTNTYYIKSGDKYLKSFVEATNRRMGLADTSEGAEWLFEDNGENGIKISNNGVYLGTAGATYDLLRSYKNESTLKWGVCFFKENK